MNTYFQLIGRIKYTNVETMGYFENKLAVTCPTEISWKFGVWKTLPVWYGSSKHLGWSECAILMTFILQLDSLVFLEV